MPDTDPQRRNDTLHRNSFAFSRLVVILPLLHSIAVAQPRSDFIVVESPQRLTILNQYQQQLSSEEKSSIVPFSPFRIINVNELLGDGLTKCMKVELDRVPMYFVKEESGEIVGGDGSKMYRNVIVYSDTIEIAKDNSVEMFDVARRKRTLLDKGLHLRRVFQSSRLTLVHFLANRQYGWVNLNDGGNKHWTIVRTAKATTPNGVEQLLPEIQRRLNAVNSKLTKLYDIWNRKASVDRVAPQWTLQPSDNTLLATLSGDSVAQFYKESTRWLSKDIETLLLGTTLRIAATAGRIEIR